MYRLAGTGQDNVGRERDQFGRLFAGVVDVGRAPAILDPHVVSLGPAQFSQGFDEHLTAGPTFRIVCGKAGGEPANAPQTLVLLRARGERPHDRTAEQRDELAAPHTKHGVTPPQSVYRTLNLPHTGWQVLGADLNCSESRRYIRPLKVPPARPG